MIPRRRIPRPQALWKQLQDAKTPPAPRQRPQRTTRRSKPAKYMGPLAITTPTAKQHTAAERRLYRAEARAHTKLLRDEGYTCPVMNAFDELPPEMQAALTVPWTGNLRSNKITEIHHSHGRIGKLLRHKPWWIGMSKFGHRAVHQFPKIARLFGWICQPGDWNKQQPT